MTRGTMSSHSRPKASVASLPVELLVVIFKDVHQQCKPTDDWKPISITSVCSFWNGAVTLIPEFWTSVPIFIDDSSFSVPHITSLLARSHDLIIDVNVRRRGGYPAMNHEHERARVMSIFEALGPHIRRCCLLFFDVQFSSSLPSFPGDFHGPAEPLEWLQLECSEDNGGADYVVSEATILQDDHQQFHFPNLHILSISGRNYFNAWQRNPLWTNMLPNVLNLEVSHFKPVATRSESFRTPDFLSSLRPLRTKLFLLTINDLDLHEPPNFMYDDLDDFGLNLLEFENMHDVNCVKAIMDFVGDPQHLHIADCCSVPVNLFHGCLSLKHVDSSEDVVKYLTQHRGRELIIDECPGFNDSVIIAMMKPTLGMFDYCAPLVRQLRIRNCPHISIPALKHLVTTRYYNHVQGQVPTLAPNRIEELELTGRVPEISPEDENWFGMWIDGFIYGD